MTAAAAAKTTAKPAIKTTTATAKTTKPAANVTTPAPKDAAAKPAPSTATKPQPPAKVAEYIDTLPQDERRYAAKEWRRVTGQRGTAPSLRGVTKERAQAIREAIAAAIA